MRELMAYAGIDGICDLSGGLHVISHFSWGECRQRDAGQVYGASVLQLASRLRFISHSKLGRPDKFSCSDKKCILKIVPVVVLIILI